MKNPSEEDDPTLLKLELARSNLKTLLRNSLDVESNLAAIDRRFNQLEETLVTVSKSVAPLQSLAMSTKALDTRINRALSPALALLDRFKFVETLQHKLFTLSSNLPSKKIPEKRLEYLTKFVDCVDRLNSAFDSISGDFEPAIQKLQEVVEFLGRTKATDQYRTLRLRETLVTLKALYETEIDEMRYEGVLDEALLSLQDDFETILLQLKHRNIGTIKVRQEENEPEKSVSDDLGSQLQVEVLKRIAETLAKNDCLDISIGIFIKVRYRRVAKALMRLNPEYLKTYAPEEIDEMEWETLEAAIALWIQHFELAVKTIFVSEKKLCIQVLGGIMNDAVWPECFVKIADKIMAVFFRFGEGVARSSKEPQKLFKLLDMFDSLEKLKTEFSEIFDGEAGSDICSRFRELVKLVVHSSSKVLWEFGLQIESNQDGFPPPQDGSVLKLVRYAINYLKYLVTDNYSASMAKILRTEQIWKAGFLSKPESDEYLLRDAIANVMEALERNIDMKKSRYKDRVLQHIFLMNTYWYIYMRTRNTDLGKLLGETFLKKKYKTVAEESAYTYQKLAWGPVVRLLEAEESKRVNSDSVIRGRMEAFMRGFDDNLRKHQSVYSIPDEDLREQIKEATVKFVVPAYAGYLNAYSSVLQGKMSVPPADSIHCLLSKVLGVDDDADGGGVERDSMALDQSREGNSTIEVPSEM